MKELSFYDQCRLYSMQRTVDHVHIIDWIAMMLSNKHFTKGQVPGVVRSIHKEVRKLGVEVDFKLLRLGLERGRLMPYDNSDYFMSGVICVNNDGTGHYPSREYLI